MSADLHVHTNCSDGIYSPQEIVAQAGAAGLKTIAITDHDSIDGHLKLGELAAASTVEVIPGIEFSTDLPANEVHILGYFIDIRHAALTSKLAAIAADRISRTQKMVAKLNELGYAICYERVLKLAGTGTVGRPHVAAALVDAGYFSDMAEVFHTVLGKNKPAYVPHYKMKPGETITLIEQAGGIPVLAHPGQVGDEGIVGEVIKLGIKGLEVYHPSHTKEQETKYLSVARQAGLLVTGGSDFHGFSGRIPERLGELYISDAFTDELTKFSTACRG